jgi:spoIIIJ-associated protein
MNASSPTPKAGKEILPTAEILMKELLDKMGFNDVLISALWEEKQERAKLSLSGEDAQYLIGLEGKTIEPLQFLFNILLSRKTGQESAIQVDALGYWDKKEKEIFSKVEYGISEVKRSNAPYRLPPMNAATRRIIHKALADHSEIESVSEGEGVWRKIILRPRKNS